MLMRLSVARTHQCAIDRIMTDLDMNEEMIVCKMTRVTQSSENKNFIQLYQAKVVRDPHSNEILSFRSEMYLLLDVNIRYISIHITYINITIHKHLCYLYYISI